MEKKTGKFFAASLEKPINGILLSLSDKQVMGPRSVFVVKALSNQRLANEA